MSDINHDYETWKNIAIENSWHIPNDEIFSKESCIAYWKGCFQYEHDKESGRPVRPHRTGR